MHHFVIERSIILNFSVLMVISIFLSGCTLFSPYFPADYNATLNDNGYIAPVTAPAGLIFEDTTVPLALEKEDNKASDKSSLHSGSSEANYFGYWLFRFGWGDDSLEDAIRDGNLSEVYYADVSHFNVLGLYREQEVIAYGAR